MTTPTPLRPNGTTPTLEGAYRPGSRPKHSFGICIYGRGGSGKTTLMGTMPGKGLLIDVPQVEGGDFVLEGAENIDVYPVVQWQDIMKVYWFLEKEAHDYKWVAVDSISAMQELAKRKTIRERSIGDDPNLITQSDWGKVGRLVGELVYQFRKLPVHTVWIAQERKFTSDDETTIWGPDVIPSAFGMLNPSMMITGRMSVEHTLNGGYVRQLRIGPHPVFYTKYRAKAGLDVPSVVEPHLGKLLAYLFGVGPRPVEISDTTSIAIEAV